MPAKAKADFLEYHYNPFRPTLDRDFLTADYNTHAAPQTDDRLYNEFYLLRHIQRNIIRLKNKILLQSNKWQFQPLKNYEVIPWRY